MDKLKRFLNVNKRIMMFLFSLFIISIIFGSVLPFFISQTDKALVSDYLKDFVSSINNYNFVSLFFNGILNNLGLCFVFFVLGISIIGSIVVIFLFFLKGFILGFSLSTIIINYGFKGVLFGFIYIFPHQIVNIFIYCILACYSISFSIKFLLFLLKRIDINIRTCYKKYFQIFCFSLCVVFLSVLYESFILPRLFSFVFKFMEL